MEHSEKLAKFLAEHRVILCCGSGGVGKTSISAMLSLLQAQRHGKTVCMTVDPAKRLLDTLGTTSAKGATARIAVDELPLVFSMINAQGILDSLGPLFDAHPLLKSHPIFQEAYQAIIGSPDLLALRDLSLYADDASVLKIVVDTPPTKNALNFLSSPTRFAEFLENGQKVASFLHGAGLQRKRVSLFNPFAVGVRTVLATFDKIFGKSTLREVVEFGFLLIKLMEDPAKLKARADELTAILKGRHTGYLIITIPRQDAIAEALRYRKQLRDRGMRIGGVIINKVFPRNGQEDASLNQLRAWEQNNARSISPSMSECLQWYERSTELIRYEQRLIAQVQEALEPEECLEIVDMLPGDIASLAVLKDLTKHIRDLA